MSRDPRHHLGRLGERLAAEHLERLGFEVLERNYRTRHGEIDLVVARDGTLVFCEVKTRRGGASVPLEAVGAVKSRRMRAMAAAWLRERRAMHGRPGWSQLRFDAIGIRIDALGRLVGLDHLEAVL